MNLFGSIKTLFLQDNVLFGDEAPQSVGLTFKISRKKKDCVSIAIIGESR